MRKTCLLCFLLISFSHVYGQDLEIDRNTNVWFTYHTKININKKWFFNNETHLRRSEVFAEWQQILIRPSFTYKLDSKISLKAGYTRIWNYPYNRETTRIIPEDNFWQRLLITQRFERSKLEHSYRYELRWIGNLEENQITGRRFVNRLRYRIKYDRDIGQQGLFLSAYGELFISIDDNYRRYGFNQVWAYASLGKQVSKKLKLQLGVFRQYIRRSSTRYESNFNIRMDVTHTLR